MFELIHEGMQCFCGAGVSPVFLQRVEIRKIAGETPASRKTILIR
jgi:hypothetical protein